jgi:prepilin-type N-terminal cleavage/methylation domain-containing protein/prepilin-type processing-associated H-X9-DG protein
MPRLRRRARGFSLVEILVVGAIVSVGLALTLPAVQRARQDARRNACKNNLKQMALAMHNYHDAFVTFPPGWIVKDVKPAAGPGYGWGTFILPFVDQAPLYNQIDFSVPPDITSSDRLQTRLNVYRCPDDTSEETNPVRDEYGTSNYSGNYGNETLPGSVDASDKASGIFFRNSKVGMRDITDGTSNTLLLGEKCISSAAGIWMGVRSNQNAGDSVTACAHETRMNTVIDSFSSRHGGGVHFALCDGSVRFISDKIDSQPAKADKMGTFQMLSHKSDGHPVGQY